MKKWKLKNPDDVIVMSNGRGTLHAGNITDELVEELIASNPNYKANFISNEDVGDEDEEDA